MALVLAFVAVTLTTPTGWLGSDDAGYYAAAEYVTAGQTITRAHHHYARLAVSLPIAASITIFGRHPWSVILPTYLAALGCVCIVTALGRMIWSWTEGLLAATLLLAVPYYTALSTVAYPDVVACFWTACGVILALIAARTRTPNRRMLLSACCGLTFSIALSAKILVAPASFAVAYVLWFQGPSARRERVVACLGVACGLLLGLLLEGAIFHVIADDALFRWRALLTSQSHTPTGADAPISGLLSMELVWDRLMMPLRRGTSGWGLIGLAFWPVMIASAVWCRRARVLVVWAVASYVAVAFAPVSLKAGWRPFPNFHGRHLLPCVIPLVLCSAWWIRRAATAWRSNTDSAEHGSPRLWPATIVLTMALYLVTRGDISGFADRDTNRVARSIEEIVTGNALGDDRPIFMTPSTYWRFRVLFPPELEPRLRVAAEPDGPGWWRDTCVGITERRQPLPPPDRAYLLATPTQLEGRPEYWDYGVALPRTPLAAWRDVEPIASVVRLADKSIALRTSAQDALNPTQLAPKPILILAGATSPYKSRDEHLSKAPPPARRLSE